MRIRRDTGEPALWALSLGGLALLLAAGWLGAPGDARAIAFASLMTAAGLACWALAGARSIGPSLATSLALGPGRPEVRGLDGLLLVVGMLALSQLIDLALQWTELREASRLATFDALLRQVSSTDLLLVGTGIVLAPAIAEELLFRGFVLGALRPRVGATLAIVGSAALFGLFHLEWVHGVAAAGLGLYLGALRLTTGSIRLGLLCHITNNTAAVLVARGVGPGPLSGAPLLALVVLAGLLSTVAAIRLWQLGHPQRDPRADPGSNSL